MLTAKEIRHTSEELTANYCCLDYSIEQVAKDLQLSPQEIEATLQVAGANPSHVWMLRDYLEEMLAREGKTLIPFTRLANHSANRWFRYEKPWRKDKENK